MKKLIITADDFGPVDGINQGIYKAIEAGKITSVASLVNFDLAEDVIQSSLPLFEKNKIELGLHFTITSGTPISNSQKIPNLVNSKGEFYNVKKLPIQKVTRQEVLTELDSQYQRFTDLYGFKPLHISNHHGVLDLIPDIYEAYLQFCEDKQLPKRSAKILPAFNKSLYYSFFVSPAFRDEFKGFYHFIRTMKDVEVINYYRGKYKSVRSPEFLDSRYFKKRTKRSLQNSLYKIKNGKTNEIMMHLFEGNLSESFNYKGIDPNYFKGRTKELEKLMNSRFFNLVKNNPSRFGLGSWTNL